MELIPGLDRIDESGEIRGQVKLENFGDVVMKERLRQKRRKVRTVTLKAIADTGAVHTLIPEEVAQELGIEAEQALTVVLANDQKISLPFASGVRLTVAGRTMT